MIGPSYSLVVASLLLFVAFVGGTEAQVSGTTPSAAPSYQPFFEIDNHEEDDSPAMQGGISPERGCGTGSLSWSANDSAEVPGIYWANLKTYCKDGVEITIWTDFESGFFGGSERAQSNGRMIVDGDSYQGRNGSIRVISGVLEANAKIAYEFEVFGNGDGIGFINKSEFHLKYGGLFLIASDGSDIEIKQIHYNTAGISTQDLKLLASRHAEIRTFFENYHQ